VLTGARRRSAIVAGLLPGIRPCRIGAWVAERKDLLSTFFLFLTLWAYARYAAGPLASRPAVAVAGGRPTIPRPDAGAGGTAPAKVFYVLALVGFACGLMSKPMVVTCPFLLLLLDYWPLEREETAAGGRGWWLRNCLFRAVHRGVRVTLAAQQSGGAIKAAVDVPFSLRAINALAAYGRYLGKT